MLMPRDIFDERVRQSGPKEFSWELAPCTGAKIDDIDSKTLSDAINLGTWNPEYLHIVQGCRNARTRV